MNRVIYVCSLVVVLLISLLPKAVSAEAVNNYEIVAGAGQSTVGKMVTFTVTGKALNDVYGAAIELEFDATKLKYNSYTSTLSGDAFVQDPKVSGNSIKLIFTYLGKRAGLSGDANLFTLTFDTIGVGDTSVHLNSVSALNSQKQSVAGVLGSDANITIVDNVPVGPTVPANPGSGSGEQPSNSTETEMVTPGVIKVEAASSTDRTGSVSVHAADLLAAARTSKDRAVLIEVNHATSDQAIQVDLPVSAWRKAKLQSNELPSITMKIDWATVSLDSKLMTGTQNAEDASLHLSISKVEPDTLSQEITRVIGTSPVYDFTLRIDDHKLTAFTNHEVLIELPYTLAAGEHPSQVVIYYLTEDGKLEVVKNGQYNSATGMVAFRPDHFSRYTAKHVSVSFEDLKGYDWANEAVLGLAAREVVQGRSEGHFVPAGDVTRAEFVQMLVTLFGVEQAAAPADFLDVDTTGWYYNAIAAARQAGLVQGKADGSFGVNDRISREDMAVLIYRISKMQGIAFEIAGTGTANVLQDTATSSDYAQEAVAALQHAGLMSGVSESSFEPKSNSTRAQAVAVLYRLYTRVLGMQ